MAWRHHSQGTGIYQWMWWADAGLALAAAVVNLPIRERKSLKCRVASSQK